MDKFFGEIPNAPSCNAPIGGISVTSDDRSRYSLYADPAFQHSPYIPGGIEKCRHVYGPSVGTFWESSLSSRSSSTSRTPSPTEEDARLWFPEFDNHRFASAMTLEELELLKKLRFLQIRENRRSVSESIVALDPSSNPGSVLPNFLSFDEKRTLPAVYSDEWIGDRRRFSYPPHLKSRCPDAATDSLLVESYLRCAGKHVYLNPSTETLNSDSIVKGCGFPILDTRFSRSDEAFGWEDSFVMQGKGNSDGCNGNDVKDRWKTQINGANTEMLKGFQWPSPCDSPFQKKETVYDLAKDQDGCRFLQKIFEEGKAEAIDLIFYGVIDHVVELMENPFGNYLMQKLLEVCSVEQRMKLIFMLTGNPSELICISLNTHGTRAVQKLIEIIKTRQEIFIVTCALKTGLLKLIKDPNGNHVVQKCLITLKAEDNKFIFDAAAKHCVEIATHRNGCCVLQCCISHSIGDPHTKLLFEISANGLLLARDAFGNYVVQYIVDLNNRAATALLLSQFRGNYAELSMQKFSSNVVEKCLKVLSEDRRAEIIYELLLRGETFEQLIQDPYGNYVVQSALLSTKGSPAHASLVQAIRPLAPKLRTNPYCRRIFSKTLRNIDH